MRNILHKTEVEKMIFGNGTFGNSYYGENLSGFKTKKLYSKKQDRKPKMTFVDETLRNLDENQFISYFFVIKNH